MAPSLKALSTFIDEILGAKLENFPSSLSVLYHDNFRLDPQSANSRAHYTSVRKAAPDSATAVLKELNSHKTAEAVRQVFHRSGGSGSKVEIWGVQLLCGRLWLMDFGF